MLVKRKAQSLKMSEAHRQEVYQILKTVIVTLFIAMIVPVTTQMIVTSTKIVIVSKERKMSLQLQSTQTQ